MTPDATYVGVDLAAEAARTGLAVLREEGEGRPGGPRLAVVELRVGADDGDVRAAIAAAERAGVDVPFGWPAPFIELLVAQAAGALTPPPSTDIAWRRTLALRATDRAVHARTGLTPLSVATDRIALPALRWAGIEARLRADGIDVRRDGAGRVCEVYPAAALRLWGLASRGYKGHGNPAARAERARILAGLEALLPRLEPGRFAALCERDDNALDALVAALVAREVARGRSAPPDPSARDLARREGWIHLPLGPPSAG